MFKYIQKIDDSVLAWMKRRQGFVLDYFCRDFSSLGGSSIIPFFAVVSSIFLYLIGDARQAGVNLLSYLVATIVVSALKEIFKRTPPSEYNPWTTGIQPLKVHHFSAMPSGHTCMSVFFYTSVAILAGRAMPAYAIFFISTALITALIIGICKIYLWAHFLSDVIIGYFLGLLFIWIWMFL